MPVTTQPLVYDKSVYRHSESVAATETSDPLIVVGFKNISVQIIVGSCTDAKIQSTMDSEAEIEAGTADWADWAPGNVAVNEGQAINSCVGLRCVNGDATNAVEWKVVA